MNTREEVYKLIDAERTAQDEVWREGRPIENQYIYSAPHILLLEEQIKKLRTDWYNSKEEDLQSRILKVAAIAVRALEEIQ